MVTTLEASASPQKNVLMSQGICERDLPSGTYGVGTPGQAVVLAGYYYDYQCMQSTEDTAGEQVHHLLPRSRTWQRTPAAGGGGEQSARPSCTLASRGLVAPRRGVSDPCEV